ncbi:hypothetical protein ACHAWO_005315 [Cyclotella atomus]|uniref:Uncharacterized protein n=1 Tax=Cyclotella atomus TaxID=382360 RepID=A0ABD3QYZ0_9STRA
MSKPPGSLPLINRNTMMTNKSVSGSGSSSPTNSNKDAMTVMTADGLTGGRRSRPSLLSLRNTEVLRSCTPAFMVNPAKDADIPRSLSGGQLNKLATAKKKHTEVKVRRASSEMEGREKRISERRVSTRAFKDKNSNSLRFHRVDVEWEAGQLDNVDMGAGGVAVSSRSHNNNTNEDMTIEPLNTEIMDLRPSTHPSLIDASFISIMDDSARDLFHTSLGVSERDEQQPSHLEVSEYPLHPVNRRASWNSCHSMSNMASDINSLSGSIISNMSMSQLSYNGRSLRSGDDTNDSTDGREAQGGSKRNVYIKKYVRPIMVIVGLATVTAAVIYIFSERLFEEGFESLTYESRTVINNGEQEGDNSELLGFREGGRMEMQVTVNGHDDHNTERRMNQARRREEVIARRAERDRRAVEKLHRTQGKKMLELATPDYHIKSVKTEQNV